MKLARPARDDEGAFYYLDNVHVTSVGVDIGSSTAHLMFSEVHLERQAEGLSRFVAVDRQVLWKSEVILTPYLPRGLIDVAAVAAFVESCYAGAGVERAEVDGGAVILTGEALKQRNARALADAVAAGSGEFVCVSAGHHLEAMLSAQGSGSVELAATTGRVILCTDMGGGTTKLSLLCAGEVVVTAAIELGGRMLTYDGDRRVLELNPLLSELGLAGVERAGVLDEEDEARLAREMARRVLAVACRRPEEVEASLLLTGPLPPALLDFGAVTFVGGVSEYVYGREQRGFGDLGRSLGAEVRAAVYPGEFGVPVLDPGQGIRATVVGASQCAVQVSGSTVAVSASAELPLRNVPVIHPGVELSGEIAATDVSRAIAGALVAHGAEGTVVLAFSFSGPRTYVRLRALAEGIDGGLRGAAAGPAVVMVDGDIGASLGRLLDEEVEIGRPLICLDNLELKPFDYVDIGRPFQPAGVFPIVIKSLLFGTGP